MDSESEIGILGGNLDVGSTRGQGFEAQTKKFHGLPRRHIEIPSRCHIAGRLERHAVAFLGAASGTAVTAVAIGVERLAARSSEMKMLERLERILSLRARVVDV